MGRTSIAWTDHSVNPIRARLADRVGHYCEQVSPGCKHCYSSRMQRRFGMPAFAEQRRRDVEPFLDESKLDEVLRRRKPTKYFWCDMTDLFGEWVRDEWIDRCFAVMALTPQHVHQVLTKRPGRMAAYFGEGDLTGRAEEIGGVIGDHFAVPSRRKVGEPAINRAYGFPGWVPDEMDYGTPGEQSLLPLPNVWLGVSAEDQPRLDERVPHLLATPAAVRFVSAEPLLEGVDFAHVNYSQYAREHFAAHGEPELAETIVANAPMFANVLTGGWDDGWDSGESEKLIDWVIFGGESGPGARPCDVEWIRDGVRQCREAGVAAFVKQLGAKPSCGEQQDHACEWKLRDRKGADPSEWPEDLRVQEFPTEAAR